MYSSKANLNLVLEFLDSDLEAIIKDRANVFLPADIKSWMAMTLRGLEFCHRNWIIHRVCQELSIHIPRSLMFRWWTIQDLKPNNLLIGANAELKLADFGLAREFADPGSKLTCQVITRWIQSPFEQHYFIT